MPETVNPLFPSFRCSNLSLRFLRKVMSLSSEIPEPTDCRTNSHKAFGTQLSPFSDHQGLARGQRCVAERAGICICYYLAAATRYLILTFTISRNFIANIDAFVADIYCGPSNQSLDSALLLTTKRATERGRLAEVVMLLLVDLHSLCSLHQRQRVLPRNHSTVRRRPSSKSTRTLYPSALFAASIDA